MACSSGTSHIIRPGDTLFNLAQQFLGDGNRWHAITHPDGSPFTEPQATDLQVGQEVCIPSGGKPIPPTGVGFAGIVSPQMFDSIFPDRKPIYTFDALLQAIKRFPRFAGEGTPEQARREAAAFFAHVSHETSGLSRDEEQTTESYCQPSATFSCQPGRSYHGRGPLQLSWNFNYGPAGQALGVNLLSDPELILSDGTLAFETALWFWMNSPSADSSIHSVMTGSRPFFGTTIRIINGGIECGPNRSDVGRQEAQDRIRLYQGLASRLGVEPGGNLDCGDR